MCYFAAAGTSMTGFQTVWFKSAHRRTVRGSEGGEEFSGPAGREPAGKLREHPAPVLDRDLELVAVGENPVLSTASALETLGVDQAI